MDKIILESEHLIAEDSPDHLYPYGTAISYPINVRFIDRMKRLLQTHMPFTEISVLDLGCGGGTFVQAVLDQGLMAVGLEGSNFSKRRKRAAWKFLSDHFLFTCDITKKFQLYNAQEKGKQPFLFDIITAWEVMEHIPEGRIDSLIENIKKHLKPLGLVILSISNNDSIHFGHELHLCKKSEEWWIKKFEKGGLYHLEHYKRYFNEQYVVGPKMLKHVINLILSTDRENSLQPPKLSLKDKFLDKWLYSKMHYRVSKLFSIP